MAAPTVAEPRTPRAAPPPWVALVGPEIEENLSLRYLASSLQAEGFATRVLAFNHEDELRGLVARLADPADPPLLVGLSLAFQWRAPDFLALAMALREAGFRGHITAGGHFATFAVQDLLRDFGELDSVCRQESERTICRLATAVRDGGDLGDIAGLSHRDAAGAVRHNAHGELPDLATLPRPDRSGAPAEVFGHGIAPLIASRGCYANCTFCCIAAWHEQALPGKRYRLRPVDDVADEMAALQRDRGAQIFVFHDDNFFLPRREANLERLTALADALDARGMRRYGIIVKARPNDVKADVFDVLQRRLHCLRAYVGIETDSEQGLITLRRWARPRHNHDAIRVLRALRLYACFNVLLFDPDTTVESLAANLDFMESTADFPFNFGRTELYAGTPLLHQMQAQGRARGDYLQWNYAMATPTVERVFRVASRAFYRRNFDAHALANVLMGTRFEVEACRHFHAEVYRPAWRDECERLTTRLGRHSVRVLREIVAHAVGSPDSAAGDGAVLASATREVDRVDAEIRRDARALARSIHQAVGAGSSITPYEDVAATPLQNPSPAALF